MSNTTSKHDDRDHKHLQRRRRRQRDEDNESDRDREDVQHGLVARPTLRDWDGSPPAAPLPRTRWSTPSRMPVADLVGTGEPRRDHDDEHEGESRSECDAQRVEELVVHGRRRGPVHAVAVATLR